MKRRFLSRLLIALSVTAVAARTAPAVEVVLETDADADIRSADLADNSYNRSVMVVGDTPTRDYKAYMRFDLPNNIDVVNSATFTVSRAVAGAWNFAYYAFGLNDGVAGETDWIESNTEGITWNTAPGNDPSSGSGFIDATPIGSFSVTGVNNGGASGDSYSFSTQELADFINADSNGYVTIMISRPGGSESTSYDQLAARTGSGTAHGLPGAMLTLEYSVAIIEGDFNEDGLVDGTDFLWWQRGLSPEPLSDTDLGKWEAGFPNASAAAHTVPEPGVASMLIGALVAVGRCAARSRSRFSDPCRES